MCSRVTHKVKGGHCFMYRPVSLSEGFMIVSALIRYEIKAPKHQKLSVIQSQKADPCTEFRRKADKSRLYSKHAKLLCLIRRESEREVTLKGLEKQTQAHTGSSTGLVLTRQRA